MCNLMRECRIKDCLLADKDVLIATKDKTIADIVSANQGDVNCKIEVGQLFVLISMVHVIGYYGAISVLQGDL